MLHEKKGFQGKLELRQEGASCVQTGREEREERGYRRTGGPVAACTWRPCGGAVGSAPNLHHQQSFRPRSISTLQPDGPGLGGQLTQFEVGKQGPRLRSLNRTFIQVIGLGSLCLLLSICMSLYVTHINIDRWLYGKKSTYFIRLASARQRRQPVLLEGPLPKRRGERPPSRRAVPRGGTVKKAC